jgi:hypothetical protein
MDPSELLALSSQMGMQELADSYPALLAELRPLGAVRTAAAFGGLLTRAELQANCLRLEALVHLAALHCEGSGSPTTGFVRRAFDSLSEGSCGVQEDPSEDVFVALVNTPRGNFRVFEGELPSRALHLVVEWATAHQAELMRDWVLCRENAAPAKIDPLN